MGLDDLHHEDRPTNIWNDLLSWSHGNHTFKFGGEIRTLQNNQLNNNNQSGTFGFSDLGTGLLGINSGSSVRASGTTQAPASVLAVAPSASFAFCTAVNSAGGAAAHPASGAGPSTTSTPSNQARHDMASTPQVGFLRQPHSFVRSGVPSADRHRRRGRRRPTTPPDCAWPPRRSCRHPAGSVANLPFTPRSTSSGTPRFFASASSVSLRDSHPFADRARPPVVPAATPPDATPSPCPTDENRTPP